MADKRLDNHLCSFAFWTFRLNYGWEKHDSTGLPSSVCVVDCAINGFIGDQISLSKGDTLVFKNRIK